MDTIVLHEYNDAGQEPGDIILWFQRHGVRGVTEDYRDLSGANALARHAMQRAASEIWRELDHERYRREKAQWEQEMSAPYGVLRRMFWGRFRRYWNPSRQSGEVWLHHQAQKKDRERSWVSQDREDRLRGAEKRRIREQEQIDRIGVDGFNRRMARQKQESIQNKAAKVDRTGKEFLRFLDWRQSPKGRVYDKAPAYGTPEKVFCGPARSQRRVLTVPMRDSEALYGVLCCLVGKNIHVSVDMMQTASVQSVAICYAIRNKKASRINGMDRCPDRVSSKRLTTHYENEKLGHLFGWGEGSLTWCLFPEEWRKYQGLEAPLGNPQKATRAEYVRNIRGCLIGMMIHAKQHRLSFKIGASERVALTVDQVMNQYFQDPFERERQKTLAAQRERGIRYQLRNRVPVVALN